MWLAVSGNDVNDHSLGQTTVEDKVKESEEPLPGLLDLRSVVQVLGSNL